MERHSVSEGSTLTLNPIIPIACAHCIYHALMQNTSGEVFATLFTVTLLHKYVKMLGLKDIQSKKNIRLDSVYLSLWTYHHLFPSVYYKIKKTVAYHAHHFGFKKFQIC